MSTPTTSPTPAPKKDLTPPTAQAGRTTIADAVVSTIAGLAAREVSGVHALGNGASRAFGALRERIPGSTTNARQGVGVEVGEKQAAVDLDIVVTYGAAIAGVAAAVRRNVTTAVERMTGLQVVEVNVAVGDVFIPSVDDAPAPKVIEAPRVS